jgi:5,5'-dehydrodivanillate O-demethylase oxygenase subunit
MDFDDFVHTGPKSIAGRYLRKFWQPVCCSYELAIGQALPMRIMDEDFTLYRGESGAAHLVGPRCAHRGTQLSVGWVEGDCIRCFYHGWKYDGSGQCVEQPAEAETFAPKVRIPSYPVKEYIGLIFAYLGEGEPPPLPRYPRLESREISLDVAGLKRICNYFNNIDNSLDNAHVRFVHRRHRDAAHDQIVLGDPTISVEESEWGITRYVKYPDGKVLTFFFGMPNINFINGQVVDPVIKRADVLVFKVPVDDQNHIHFEVRAIALTEERGRAWIEERREMRAKAERDRPELVRAILAGKLRLSEVDPNRIDFVMLEDEVAQTGQGSIAPRSNEHLGRSDRGVFLLRKIWERELRNLAEGRPIKQWVYQPDMVPTYPEA